MNNQAQPRWTNDQPEVTYKTVFNEHLGQLDDEITSMLNDGWQPGGPQYYVEDKKWFVQSMVRVSRPPMASR